MDIVYNRISRLINTDNIKISIDNNEYTKLVSSIYEGDKVAYKKLVKVTSEFNERLAERIYQYLPFKNIKTDELASYAFECAKTKIDLHAKNKTFPDQLYTFVHKSKLLLIYLLLKGERGDGLDKVSLESLQEQEYRYIDGKESEDPQIVDNSIEDKIIELIDSKFFMEKELPGIMKEVSPKRHKLFCMYYGLGDGHYNTVELSQYYNTSHQLVITDIHKAKEQLKKNFTSLNEEEKE